MRTPSSALPAWPCGFVEGFGRWPLPFTAAALVVLALRLSALRAALVAVRAARASAASMLCLVASAFFGARTRLAEGFAAPAAPRAAACAAARRAAAAFLVTRAAA